MRARGVKRNTRAGLQKGLLRIHKEGQGVWRIETFDCANMPEFMIEVLLSGPPTSGFLRAVFDVACGLATGQRACDCLLCGVTFGTNRMPRDISVLHAMRDDPSEAIALCICNDCHDDDQEAMAAKITSYLKANMISDLRRLPPMATAGTA
jgi:hypothetical protein